MKSDGGDFYGGRPEMYMTEVQPEAVVSSFSLRRQTGSQKQLKGEGGFLVHSFRV